jgi:hypothetical protein
MKDLHLYKNRIKRTNLPWKRPTIIITHFSFFAKKLGNIFQKVNTSSRQERQLTY